jgi:hypothetical protein
MTVSVEQRVEISPEELRRELTNSSDTSVGLPVTAPATAPATATATVRPLRRLRRPPAERPVVRPQVELPATASPRARSEQSVPELAPADPGFWWEVVSAALTAGVLLFSNPGASIAAGSLLAGTGLLAGGAAGTILRSLLLDADG